MDGIKLYAKHERDIDSLIYSSNTVMSFGLEKCSSQVVRTEGIELPDGNTADIEDSYQYLGIPRANGNHEEAAGKAATTKCRQGVRECLKSLLNGKNKIRTISTYALLVVRYPLG